MGSYALAERNDYTWDLTKKQSFTLSDQGKRVADAITFDVKVTAFFRTTAPGRARFADLIERFTERSGKITVEWSCPPKKRREGSDIKRLKGGRKEPYVYEIRCRKSSR